MRGAFVEGLGRHGSHDILQRDRDQTEDQQHEKPARQEFSPVCRITPHRPGSRGAYDGSIAAGTNVSTGGALATLSNTGALRRSPIKKYERLISRRRQRPSGR